MHINKINLRLLKYYLEFRRNSQKMALSSLQHTYRLYSIWVWTGVYVRMSVSMRERACALEVTAKGYAPRTNDYVGEIALWAQNGKWQRGIDAVESGADEMMERRWRGAWRLVKHGKQICFWQVQNTSNDWHNVTPHVSVPRLCLDISKVYSFTFEDIPTWNIKKFI